MKHKPRAPRVTATGGRGRLGVPSAPKQHTVTEGKQNNTTEKLSNIARMQDSLTVHKIDRERESLKEIKTLTKKRVSDYTVQYNPWAV